MSDIDLLTLAAIACQYELFWANHEPHIIERNDHGLISRITPWNPLTDDGDSLRLAVKLGFINPGCWPDASRVIVQEHEAGRNIDWYEATRVAIVHAAAERGRKMQDE